MRKVSNKGVICFFCLRRVKEYYIVDYEVKELGMTFKVYACLSATQKSHHAEESRPSKVLD
ncbi:hypothetical protein [Vulcanisaeta sp. JCM 16161]|uniref:hypothetical protein n=1 Tax=Vulcanisaeta sp. JCM 16161 TaxID=1295372 RepID=UPI000AC8199D|nr:hypothetical protein [Vulcanisaeta sp. JCM 16161]